MPAHAEQQILPYSTEELFTLVADIARYSEFLPWCRAARILEKKDNEMLAELVICYNHLCESYTSRVVLTPHSAIEVAMVKGPFEYLTNSWRFTPVSNGTQVDFALDFKFRSKLLERMMGGFFTKATAKMIDAFKARAHELYGKH